MSSLVCHFCYVHCRTHFYHVDIFIFPVSLSHVYFRYWGHFHSDILHERSSVHCTCVQQPSVYRWFYSETGPSCFAFFLCACKCCCGWGRADQHCTPTVHICMCMHIRAQENGEWHRMMSQCNIYPTFLWLYWNYIVFVFLLVK
jgi:hypothetical protein